MSQEFDSVALVPDSTVRHLTGAVLLAALTGVLAQVSVPLPGGIPFSLQPFAVFFAGLLLGPLWGGFAMLLYLLVGLAGAPVFSNAGAGLGYVLGPTGGFLVGFLVAATVAGGVAHRSVEPKPFARLSVPGSVAALLIALVPIYGVGVPWFAWVQGWELVRAGAFMAPFLVGDLLKVAITVGVVAAGAELER